jgi:hypothetical protein
MIRGIALAALSSFTLAVKQQDPQMESVFTKDVSEGNAGETMTWWSYPMDDLDKTKELVDSWLGEKAGPFIKQHRNKVYKAALADTEKRMGTLHETCDEGTKCREEVYEQLQESIHNSWVTTVENFKDHVAHAMKETKRVVEKDYTDMLQCRKDHPCCDCTQDQWEDLQIRITTKRREIISYETKWEEFEQRLKYIEVICPSCESIPLVCPSAEAGVCADGSDRREDCTCPPPKPVCPDYQFCKNGGV